jgi:hypothetical protein
VDVLAFRALGCYRARVLIVLEVLALIALLAASYAARGAFSRLRRAEHGTLGMKRWEAMHAHVEDLTEEVASLRAEYAEVSAWKQDITLAVDEGIRHVDRAENRVRSVIRRAREKLEENGIEYGALEAEASELRIRDGSGSPLDRMQPVPTEVGRSTSAPPGVPGYFSPEHLKALRGA